MTVVDDRTLTDEIPENDIAFVTEQIEQHQTTATDTTRQRRSTTMRPIMWRLHFLGGFLVGPLVLTLCISGILYAWNPQLDDVRFGDIMHRSSAEVNLTLEAQVEAAQAEYPDWEVYSVTPGHNGDNTKITMDPPGGAPGFGGPEDAVGVYVDQATGQVTGAIDKTETSDNVTRRLHSSLLLGDKVEPFIELAGAWFLATLLTGLYLWWPGLRNRGSIAFAKRFRLAGRRNDKEWHNFIGVALFVPMILLAATGLTWTQFSGDRVDLVKEQLSVPRNGADNTIQDPSPTNLDLAVLDVAYGHATAAAMVEPVEIVIPADDATAWVVSSRDATFPVERDQIAVDGTTGQVTSSFDYNDEHWFNKMRTSAILFHQAQLFGWPLQIFMSLLAGAVAALVIFGYRMWWQRRPEGGIGAPPSIRSWVRSAPLPVLAATAFVAWLLPTLGISLLIWLVLEAGWRWLQLARNSDAARIDLTAETANAGAKT